MSLKSAVANYLRVRPGIGAFALRCCPDIRWNIRIDPIGKVMIRLRRNRSFWLRNPLSMEWKAFGFLLKLVRPGDVIYDVGSNIGVYARFFVQVFGASRVIGFEPMTENHELLMVNLQRVKSVAERVTILKMALSDADAEVDLQIDDISSGSAVLDVITGGRASEGRRQYNMAPRTEKVSARMLDHVMDQEKLPPPGLIKIDIEGAAAMALRGAVKTLEKYRPRLVIELHGEDEGRGVFDVLKPLGYHCFGMFERNGQVMWAELERSDIHNSESFWQPHFLIASFDVTEISAEMPPATADQLRLATAL